VIYDSIPFHRKFGYQQMLEMRQLEDALRSQGLSGIALHFAVVHQYEEAHKSDPSFRQRQEIARANGEKWIAGGASLPSDVEILRAALEAIRDGHNDPRALAREVLERVVKEPHDG
jgi:hypothetical protein